MIHSHTQQDGFGYLQHDDLPCTSQDESDVLDFLFQTAKVGMFLACMNTSSMYMSV